MCKLFLRKINFIQHGNAIIDGNVEQGKIKKLQ